MKERAPVHHFPSDRSAIVAGKALVARRSRSPSQMGRRRRSACFALLTCGNSLFLRNIRHPSDASQDKTRGLPEYPHPELRRCSCLATGVKGCASTRPAPLGRTLASHHVNKQGATMKTTQNVKDLMNSDIMTVTEDMTINALAQYLVEREISGAPVVDNQGHLIGVVSMTDIGRNMAEPAALDASRSSGFYRDIAADLTLEDLEQRYAEERAVCVRDVMTPAIYQVPVTASAAEAARLMVDQHIHRLVVTQGREPVGMITSLDLLKVVVAR